MTMDLATATALILHFKYWIMVPVAFFEGPILAMLCGILIHQGLLELVPTFALLYFVDLLGDAMWYWLGREWGLGFLSRFGRFVSITENQIEIMRKLFQKYHVSILLFSKITMGLGFPGAVLFTAGLSHIPFPRYMLLNATGQIVWTGFLVGVGYWLGHVVLEKANNLFGVISTGAIIIIVFLLLYGFSKYLRQRITESMS